MLPFRQPTTVPKAPQVFGCAGAAPELAFLPQPNRPRLPRSFCPVFQLQSKLPSVGGMRVGDW